MRTRRLAILAGCAGAALWTAPAAVGCELTGLSARGPSGTTVHPGDAVAYSFYARTTDSSPQDSSYTINIDSHGGLASGYADPSANGGESTETGTFTMPDLGGGAMAVTVSAIADNGGYVATTLQYVGAATAQASTQPPAPAPAAGTKPGGGDQVQQAVPTVAPAPHASMPHAQPAHRTLTFRPPARHALRGHVQRAAASVPLATPATAPAIVAHPVVKPAIRFARQRHSAPAVRHVSDRVAPVALVVHAPAAARTHRFPREVLLTLALLALAAGAGGAYAMARRRAPRSPLAAAAIDADGAIEAELQELLAEERAREVSAEHAGTPP